jgi:hypothetical protein
MLKKVAFTMSRSATSISSIRRIEGRRDRVFAMAPIRSDGCSAPREWTPIWALHD